MGEGKRGAPGPSAADAEHISVIQTMRTIHVGQVGNLRGGCLPPPVRCERGIGPINNRPDPEGTPTKLPHKVCTICYFSSMVITRSTGGFSTTCLPPPGQVTVSLSTFAAAPNPKCRRGGEGRETDGDLAGRWQA